MSEQSTLDLARDRVVVGIDGSDQSYAALDAAARQSRRLGRGLHLLCAAEVLAVAPHELGWAPGFEDDVIQGSERMLDQAREHVLAQHPDLDITTQAMWGSPAGVLIEASKVAAAVVVGSRGRGGWAGLLIGSVSLTVAAHAHCPVVVMPHREDQVVSVQESGPVVLGVDEANDASAAAVFAFRQAAALGVPVQAVHTWVLGFEEGAVPTDPGSEAMKSMQSRQLTLIDATLAQAKLDYPDVPVEVDIVRGKASAVLAERSKTASLVVVGSRGRGGFAGLLLGSTSRALLQSTASPIAVVRKR